MPKTSQISNGVKGFTLIEAIIAVSVLTIGIVGVLAMFPMGTQVAKSAQMASIAAHLGQEKIEEITPVPYAAILIATTAEGYGRIPGFSAHRRVTKVSCFDPNGPVLTPNCPEEIGVKKIEVTVFWRSPLGGVREKSINVVSLIAKR